MLSEKKRACPMANLDYYSDNILTYIRKKLKQKYPDKKPLRTFHAKTIGLVQAKFKVDDDLDDSLKVGLFKEVKTYDAWIRFTNGSPDFEPDNHKAARGMAIKIMNVKSSEYLDEDTEGNTQDIILVTSRIFVPGISCLQINGVKAALTKPLAQYFHAAPVIVTSPKASLAFLKSVIVSPNILEEMYYSGTPYSFGPNKVIKWHARPLKTITSVMPKHPKDDFLRSRLRTDLSKDAKDEISFALFVQFQESEKTEPIDDSGVEWKTPFHQVATIMIPRQDIDTDERTKKDLELTYSPGHSIIEHAPLGSVNMIRRKVYEQLAKERIAHQ